MNIFDIMGPVMVGPSSSHTAGAARMGFIARKLLGFQPARADIALHGSFAATGAGHGTDKAIVAGLLGMAPDDPNIPRSFQLAKAAGLEITVRSVVLRDAHPNTAVMTLVGSRGRTVTVSASSLGGGRIRVNSIDGLEAAFSGDLPTLIIRGKDEPGVVSEVSSCLARRGANIATMQLYRDRRGGLSVTVIECDEPVSEGILEDIDLLGGVVRCIYLNLEEG
ncbi:MAG: L-serine ammonia-lyase, iron-sulfur-dependent, subunit beta [Oscillospiraceae bacterium]|nr:L-serine ammonia-lyase, iron-sulfur-dependent, subunit beta [Oscillospiraceae bacterium]MDE6841657.1 L-serine ammonia-lyase, iron-sulfur-dependent subunit beta [Oscillospiraceae bacterium]